MGRYLVRRFLLSLLSLWGLASLCFFLLRFLPGGPFLEEEQFHPLIRQSLEEAVGLRDPLLEQYFRYLIMLSRFDFGLSYRFPETSVLDLLTRHFIPSFQLAGYAFLLCLLGLVLFAYASTRSPRAVKMGNFLSLLGFALPGLVLAPLLVDFFALQLGWLPVARVESAWGFVLPVVAISLRPSLRLGQILVGEMQRLLSSDVARTARAQGFSEKRVFFYWIFPEAFVAVVAQLGTLVAQLLAGSFFIEVVFAIPGFGTLFADALAARDYPVVLGVILWTGALAFLSQFVVDLILVRLDPRIGFEEGVS